MKLRPYFRHFSQKERSMRLERGRQLVQRRLERLVLPRTDRRAADFEVDQPAADEAES